MFYALSNDTCEGNRTAINGVMFISSFEYGKYVDVQEVSRPPYSGRTPTREDLRTRGFGPAAGYLKPTACYLGRRTAPGDERLTWWSQARLPAAVRRSRTPRRPNHPVSGQQPAKRGSIPQGTATRLKWEGNRVPLSATSGSSSTALQTRNWRTSSSWGDCGRQWIKCQLRNRRKTWVSY